MSQLSPEVTASLLDLVVTLLLAFFVKRRIPKPPCR